MSPPRSYEYFQHFSISRNPRDDTTWRRRCHSADVIRGNCKTLLLFFLSFFLSMRHSSSSLQSSSTSSFAGETFLNIHRENSLESFFFASSVCKFNNLWNLLIFNRKIRGAIIVIRCADKIGLWCSNQIEFQFPEPGSTPFSSSLLRFGNCPDAELHKSWKWSAAKRERGALR